MIRLSCVIEQFENDFLAHYGKQLLPSQRNSLSALKRCRNQYSPLMKVQCEHCHVDKFLPHSCGNRHCPHCQHHASQQWIENQCRKQLPVNYFMLTFTVPAQLRSAFYKHQKQCYRLLFDVAWSTLQSFSNNDKKLQGTPGVTAVLHTHSRALAYHPHLHVVIPAAAINKSHRLWREKQGKYLFSHKALAKVFRARMLSALYNEKLRLPEQLPEQWVVDCRPVGSGDKAFIYLGRYLYRGVIQEKNILSCQNGHVTFRYLDSRSKKYQVVSVPGAKFLWLVIQHTLPKGFRRARNFGFLHPNSKTLIRLIKLTLQFNPERLKKETKTLPRLLCQVCNHPMQIVQTLIERKMSIERAPI